MAAQRRAICPCLFPEAAASTPARAQVPGQVRCIAVRDAPKWPQKRDVIAELPSKTLTVPPPQMSHPCADDEARSCSLRKEQEGDAAAALWEVKRLGRWREKGEKG